MMAQRNARIIAPYDGPRYVLLTSLAVPGGYLESSEDPGAYHRYLGYPVEPAE